jgi:isopenicillin-N N-acyltransferase-like protein
LTLEHLVLSGEPYDRGHRHGQRFAAEIAANAKRYFDKLAHYDIAEETALDMAAKFIPLIEDSEPAYAEEMRGIADGSDRPLDEIALLNARYEVTYGAYANAAIGNDTDAAEADARSGVQPDGCTSFGLQGEVTANNRPYIG